MISVRIARDVERNDGKKAASAGEVGLVDAGEWVDGTRSEVRVRLEGRTNRATVPRDAVTPIKFGLWDPHGHGFLYDGVGGVPGAIVAFDDPYEARSMAEDTHFVVAEIPDGPWAPPAVHDGTVSGAAAALLALEEPG